LKISIIGGTGDMGRGLTIRWAQKHDIILGSRNLEKAQKTSEKLNKIAKGFYQNHYHGSITGLINKQAIQEAQVIVICIPPNATIELVEKFKKYLGEDQTIISTVVPMTRKNKLFYFTPLTEKSESAAEIIQQIVEPTHVISAFQTIPASYLNNIDAVLNLDVLLAGDDELSVAVVSGLVTDIENLRPLYVGPLNNSKFIESITPLLLNAATLNDLKDPSIRVVPWVPKYI
jgi:NADPH-dependent F420 reductase